METPIKEDQNDKLGPHARRIKKICPALLDLLRNGGKTLLQVLESDEEIPLQSDIPWYWHKVHIMFIFRILVNCTSTELSTAVMNSHSSEPRAIGELPYSRVTTSELSQRLELFQSLLEETEECLKNYEQKEDTTFNNNDAVPMAKLAQAYQMKSYEIRTLQFLVTLKTQPSPCVLDLVMPPTNRYGYIDNHYIPTSGGDEKMAYPPTTIRYACGVTALDWAALANEDHALCSDRVLILILEEYGDGSKLTVSEEACRALMGWPLKSEERLKLAGTKLLKLINGGSDNADGYTEEVQRMTSESSWSVARKVEAAAASAAGEETGSDTMADILGRLSLRNVDDANIQELKALEDALSSAKQEESGIDTLAEDVKESGEPEEMECKDFDEPEDEDPTKPKAYKSELEYLNQFFELVMHKVMYSKQRVAQDLRNASLSDNKPSWMRSAADNPSNKRSVGEISAKIKLTRRKMQLSLDLTRREGDFYPRLELLAEQLQLDDFEKFVLVYLAGSMISPIFKSAVHGEDTYGDKTTKVGDLLVAYFDNFTEQVSNRPYFYRSSTLLRKGLVRFINSYRSPNDLTDQEIKLDRRVLDCVVGLDKESSEVSKGSHLYDPKVSLDAVVLPEKLKETITGAVTHFEQFRTYRKHNPDFDDAIAYGVGLTLMFCGKSGTGKTMTANAIAAKLKKKLLLVNFPLLQQQSHSKESETSMYQSIFREAELSDAIIFFDECESLFSQRASGGSSETTELLTELERFEGIVFLATNRPFDLDEAMYRRISEVFEFKAPNYLERLEIWKLVTSHKAVPCDPAIDFESIALQYELTGGYIKNAVISALMDAVGRDPRSPMILQTDILNGCKKQVRGALQMVEFNERVVPRGGLSDLVASDEVMGQIKEIVNLEKARGILFGSWGFDSDMRARQGTTALFWGASGTGRSRAAEAIGFELGKPLKVVDLPRLLSEQKNPGNTPGDGGGKAARSIFHEARLMDAVLVLDGFSLESEGGGGGAATDTRLLNIVMREMTRFPGVVIMMVDTTGSLDVFVSRIDKTLLKSLKVLVEFKLPTTSKRQILWQKLIPPTLPVSNDIDCKKLAEASNDFSVAHIGNAVYRAAASAALRTNAKERIVSMKDLYQAIEEEKTRGESAVDRWVKAQYI